jgi:hypothetical protein
MDAIKAGRAVVLGYQEEGTVKSIELRYFMRAFGQEYVQPVYYFECTDEGREFEATVPAIRAEYLKSVEETLKEMQEQERQAQEQKKQTEQAQTIAVTISRRPEFASKGIFYGAYYDGTNERTFSEDDSSGPMIVKGAEKLGGELMVCFAWPREKMSPLRQRAWAYMKNVQKRRISLPEDADVVLNEEDFIDIELAFDAERALEFLKDKTIGFYLWEGAKYPVFVGRDKRMDEPTGELKVAMRVVPREYHVMGVEKVPEEGVFLGKVTITGEAGRTYYLDVAAEEGP